MKQLICDKCQREVEELYEISFSNNIWLELCEDCMKTSKYKVIKR